MRCPGTLLPAQHSQALAGPFDKLRASGGEFPLMVSLSNHLKPSLDLRGSRRPLPEHSIRRWAVDGAWMGGGLLATARPRPGIESHPRIVVTIALLVIVALVFEGLFQPVRSLG